jgi:hypothetical protein
MSSYAPRPDMEVRSVGAVTDAKGDRGGTTTPTDGDKARIAEFWKARIGKRKGMEDYTKWTDIAKRAREAFHGDLLDKTKLDQMGDGTVGACNNSWRRIASYFWDAIFSSIPISMVRPAEGRNDELTLGGASAVQAFLKHVFNDAKIGDVFLCVLKAAYFDNVCAAKVEFDPLRGYFRVRWVPHFLVDAMAHGDLSNALWVVEEIKVSRMSVLSNPTFPLSERQKLATKWAEKAGSSGMDFDTEACLYYITSREGADPQATVAALVAGQAPEKQPKACFVVCDDYAGLLYEHADPTPWLDEDEYGYPVCTLEKLPGEWYGSPPWKLVEPLINAINWLITFYVTAMKKRAMDIHLFNKEIVKDVKKITASSCFEAHGVDGDPSKAHSRVDLGANDTAQLQGAEALQGWLDQLSGFNEVARGESSGRKTATEVDNLQKNTSLVVKGPSRSFDSFMGECFRQMGLASILWIPAFSWKIGPGGEVMTRKATGNMIPGAPVIDPATGMPQVDPATGAPKMGKPTPEIVDVPVEPQEAAEVGAIDDGTGLGPRMPGTEVTESPLMAGPDGMPMQAPISATHPEAGKTLKKGVDYFIGDEWAAKWSLGIGPKSYEDTKRDLRFVFEVGSTRADFRAEQQQASMLGLQVLAPYLQQTGSFKELHALLQDFNQSLPLASPERRLPPLDQFEAMMTQAMQAAQEAEAQKNAGPPQPQGPQDGQEVEVTQ